VESDERFAVIRATDVIAAKILSNASTCDSLAGASGCVTIRTLSEVIDDIPHDYKLL
jgi:hypothetical protein